MTTDRGDRQIRSHAVWRPRFSGLVPCLTGTGEGRGTAGEGITGETAGQYDGHSGVTPPRPEVSQGGQAD